MARRPLTPSTAKGAKPFGFATGKEGKPCARVCKGTPATAPDGGARPRLRLRGGR